MWRLPQIRKPAVSVLPSPNRWVRLPALNASRTEKIPPMAKIIPNMPGPKPRVSMPNSIISEPIMPLARPSDTFLTPIARRAGLPMTAHNPSRISRRKFGALLDGAGLGSGLRIQNRKSAETRNVAESTAVTTIAENA
jgi:hypothetical protein